jgi:hypothetical protein
MRLGRDILCFDSSNLYRQLHTALCVIPVFLQEPWRTQPFASTCQLPAREGRVADSGNSQQKKKRCVWKVLHPIPPQEVMCLTAKCTNNYISRCVSYVGFQSGDVVRVRFKWRHQCLDRFGEKGWFLPQCEPSISSNRAKYYFLNLTLESRIKIVSSTVDSYKKRKFQKFIFKYKLLLCLLINKKKYSISRLMCRLSYVTQRTSR